MKVLFATTNPAKVKKYKEGLQKSGIELITINDLDVKVEVNENRKKCTRKRIHKGKNIL